MWSVILKLVMLKPCYKFLLQGYNDKVWQEIPETCKELPETKCIKVDKVRNVKEKYTKCDQEPYEDCKKVPEERCVPITKEKCEDVPYEECNDVTTEVCEEQHFQVKWKIYSKPWGEATNGNNDTCDAMIFIKYFCIFSNNKVLKL